uniref:DISC1 scaffold protein n=1 Tax=Castor canadensis TaxID=51338 RepID=A0A8C0WSM2_CASCN
LFLTGIEDALLSFLFPGSRDCSPPAVSFRRRRLARRPGYMRSAAGPGIGFLSSAVGTPCQAPGSLSSEESRAGQCSLDLSSWQGPGVGSPVPKDLPATTVVLVDPLSSAQTSVRRTPVGFGVQLRPGTGLPDRQTRPCGPGDAGCLQKLLSMDTSEARAMGLWPTGSLAPVKVSGNRCSLRSGPQGPPGPPGSQDTFTSSFSFIQLSLDPGSAGERGEAEGCPPSREAECSHRSSQEMGDKAASSDRPHGDLQCLSQTFSLTATQGSADSAQMAMRSSNPQCDTLSFLDVDGSSSSLDSSSTGCGGDKGSSSQDAHDWDTLLREWEPVLHTCLLSHHRQLEVGIFSSIKASKLQEKAIEDGDYGSAETLKQRLEDLEQESDSLALALPSQQPAVHSFLGHLATQARAALHQATQLTGSDDTPTPLGGEVRLLEPTAQDSLQASVTRWERLLQEKQLLQKEIEALQAKMSVLEAKDQQLRREMEEFELQLQWQSCNLMPLMARLSPGQLQEASQATRDTLASARQVPFFVEPPETIKSLQERTKSLHLSVKEITVKVCTMERLCSILRRRLSDLETRLPTLLEAQMLAVAGSHFCTAKDLEEEIRSLTSEREGLEAVLGRLSALSSRTPWKLAGIKEDYSRLKRELRLREAAHRDVKENTAKYMEELEARLSSSQCPLLGKVWEADLEACGLLMQSLQLQEARVSLCAEDEAQTDGAGTAAWMAPAVLPRPHCEDDGKTPCQAFHECRACLAPSLCCAGSEQKEESCVLFADLGEKCKAIGAKLQHLEGQLHAAIHSQDEDLIHILCLGELKMVKETLQSMTLQLQPAKEAEEGEAVAFHPTAGAQEAPA